MPFVSDKQRKFLYKEKPSVAKKFAEHADELTGASSASQNALFKEELPSKMHFGDVWMNDKKTAPKFGRQLEAAGGEGTLMGRLAERMTSRDMIDELNLGPKGTTGKAKMAQIADDGVAKTAQIADFTNEIPSKIMIGAGLHEQFHDVKASNFSNPIPNGKVREGSNMAEQAKNAGHIFNTMQKKKVNVADNDMDDEDDMLKHGDDPDSDFNSEQLKLGIEVEKEHSDDPKIAKQIAKAHLAEIPDYYTRLKKMESEAKK